MALGVEGEHACRSDRDVVDVAAVLADFHSVEHTPPRVELGELSGDLLLALRSNAPRTFVGLHAE
jgi:hypothetical protein